MSLRYTGEATMDEPALRDVERWKDKIEVRLDNRQVFFLFFGSAMVACMLFVLGVIVGKRLESRGRAEAPPVEDPLAVLDRFGALTTAVPAPAALTFPKALIGNGQGAGASKNKASAGAEKAERASNASSATNERIASESVNAKTTLTAGVPLPHAAPVAPVTAPKAATTVAVEPTVRPAPATQKAASALKLVQPPKLSAATAAPAGLSSTGTSNRLAALPRPVTAANKTSSSVGSKEPSQPAKVAATYPVDKSKGRFLLQLSSFQDRSEADAFARRFSAQNAYVVATEIPGKGTWYRVRVGSYGTLQDASAAKTSFERDHNVIAYVAGSGPAK